MSRSWGRLDAICHLLAPFWRILGTSGGILAFLGTFLAYLGVIFVHLKATLDLFGSIFHYPDAFLGQLGRSQGHLEDKHFQDSCSRFTPLGDLAVLSYLVGLENSLDIFRGPFFTNCVLTTFRLRLATFGGQIAFNIGPKGANMYSVHH